MLLLVTVIACVSVAGVASAHVTPSAPPPFPLNYVDPRIGTGSADFGISQNNPAAQYPFGALRLGPDTSLGRLHTSWAHYGGYLWSDTYVRAFSHTHVVGAGLPDFANFGVMPLRTAIPTTDQITDHNYRSRHSHDTETMYPGYYATYLETHHVLAELTAAGTFAGVHRYTYSPHEPVTLLLDVVHDTNNYPGKRLNASITFSDLGDVVEIDASLNYMGELTGRNGIGIWLYLHGRLSSSSGRLQGSGIWAAGQVFPDVTSRAGENSESLGGYFHYASAANSTTVLTMEVGISFVSPALARTNLHAQLRGRSFDETKADAYSMWSQVLSGTGEILATRPRDMVAFYTAMYRTFMSPTDYVESDGSYVGFDQHIHQMNGRRYYSDLSLWDTFRSMYPWQILVQPVVAGDIVNSLVVMYEQGQLLARWPIANVYTDCMFGDNANVMFLDAWRKGVRSFNITKAYEAMRANAMGPQPRDGRANVTIYIELGYVPIEYDIKGTPSTLAYAYNDWCLAEVAGDLGLVDDETIFRKRAGNWRNVFSTDELFVCARFLNGTFKCPDFHFNRFFDDNFVEGNTWHYTWDVPHDLDNFVLAWPSPEAFVDKLVYSLNKSTTVRLPFAKNWLPNPFYWQGNEHNLLFPWEFNKVGRADLTQYWTRWMLENKYSDLPDGLPGQDDYGELSAWYIFGALGLYPLAGADWYFVGSPVVDKATLTVGNSRGRLTIIAINNSPQNVYVDSITLDGEPLTEPYLLHSQLVKDTTELVFTMSSDPNTPFNLRYAERWREDHKQRRNTM